MTPVEAAAVEHHGGVFARYFIELPIDPKRVERALTQAPDAWLRGLASEANHRGDTLLAEIGFGDRIRVARTVAIELGDPVHTAGKVVLPLRWTPTDAPGLFPALEADLEVAPLPPDRTQLAMSARYVPPLGPLGQGRSTAPSCTASLRRRSRTSSTGSGRRSRARPEAMAPSHTPRRRWRASMLS